MGKRWYLDRLVVVDHHLLPCRTPLVGIVPIPRQPRAVHLRSAVAFLVGGSTTLKHARLLKREFV